MGKKQDKKAQRRREMTLEYLRTSGTGLAWLVRTRMRLLTRMNLELMGEVGGTSYLLELDPELEKLVDDRMEAIHEHLHDLEKLVYEVMSILVEEERKEREQ